ncbi:MAG TPA: toll/interleukin-1 receptor domain-containing protein, partial [Candidatus Binatia bacterium]|nr:toll/interleukin-1 receptor domain-containing protein [Candidatus Binatia bacterium]
MTAIFISHSSVDNAAAAEMKAWLEAQGHTSLFLDFDPEVGIKGGTAWEQTLYQQLRQCQAMIALLTPSCQFLAQTTYLYTSVKQSPKALLERESERVKGVELDTD